MAFRFVNLDGSEPHAFSAVLKWALVDRLMGRRRTGPVGEPAPRVAPDLELLRSPPAPGQAARLTWIGHASWLVQLDGISLLIDPIFSESLGPGTARFVAPALAPGELPAIDATLITHNHRDHLDLPSVRVRFVPSQHWSQRALNDRNATLWGGFVIEGSTACIYHSGDTAYFDGFSEIGRRAGPIDAALLPIGAYDPAWFMSKQHMNPEEATQAFCDLRARQFVAMHWGTFKLTDEPLDEPPARLEAAWKSRELDRTRCHVLPVGGVIEVYRANA
jgi:L-ascorbate metabolism protein UlaG (beta-lactamase superfamily)